MPGYLASHIKSRCCGCEACAQVCPKDAISMSEDEEGFQYPCIDGALCVQCGMCYKVCPYENDPERSKSPLLVFGGYHKNETIREASTSGGAFTALANGWCDDNSVIFGAVAQGITVRHEYTAHKGEIAAFRKSKYVQSQIGNSYAVAKDFLQAGKKVLFSGTPCQIAGLRAFLGGQNWPQLLTVEVICEGVPSPHFIRSYNTAMQEKFGSKIKDLDYRFKDGRRWDFEVMTTLLENGRCIKMDRWFNPFWSIWLDHLMSRPSCYECPYAATARTADITLGDLWGVHLYCPELYGNNGGASLILCNMEQGVQAFETAQRELTGHKLNFEEALKYQSPLRKAIDGNPQRGEFMRDVKELSYEELCGKWGRKPSFHLLWSKYVWGNRQKVFMWNVKQKILSAVRR